MVIRRPLTPRGSGTILHGVVAADVETARYDCPPRRKRDRPSVADGT